MAPKNNNVQLQKFEQAADIFKGFANPARIRIIDALKDREMRVMDLASELGYTQPIISQQLKILRSAGIVQRVRVGNNFFFSLTNQHYADIMKCIRGCLNIQ